MPLPKTLIIGQPFNNDFGGGITQANLFGGWDKNKIAVVCTDHMFNNLNTDICDTYYILGKEEYKWAPKRDTTVKVLKQVLLDPKYGFCKIGKSIG